MNVFIVLYYLLAFPRGEVFNNHLCKYIHKTCKKTILFSNSTFKKKKNYIIHFLHQTAPNDFSSLQTQIQKSQIPSQKIQSAVNETMSKDRRQTLKFIKKRFHNFQGRKSCFFKYVKNNWRVALSESLTYYTGFSIST